MAPESWRAIPPMTRQKKDENIPCYEVQAMGQTYLLPKSYFSALQTIFCKIGKINFHIPPIEVGKH